MQGQLIHPCSLDLVTVMLPNKSLAQPTSLHPLPLRRTELLLCRLTFYSFTTLGQSQSEAANGKAPDLTTHVLNSVPPKQGDEIPAMLPVRCLTQDVTHLVSSGSTLCILLTLNYSVAIVAIMLPLHHSAYVQTTISNGPKGKSNDAGS